jgi:hypothetical protein
MALDSTQLEITVDDFGQTPAKNIRNPLPFGSLANSSIGELGESRLQGATVIFDHHSLAEIALAAIVRT